MAKVVHCKKDPYDVYIGRPSIWGNPYSHKEGTLAKYKVDTREEAIQRYKTHLLDNPDLLAKIEELRGKTLGCWCRPQRCHGDIIIEVLEDRGNILRLLI